MNNGAIKAPMVAPMGIHPIKIPYTTGLVESSPNVSFKVLVGIVER